MPLFTKESLELLKNRVNLVDVLSSHIELKHSGTAYKALCPFHDEKSPSFVVQRGDSHYHCFGCGVHGDAIQFLMLHLKMSFVEAVEYLAERFHVPLEKMEGEETKGPNKSALKEALEAAALFFQTILLHTAEGHEALHYLYKRGIDLNFIRHFGIGLAPKKGGLLQKVMHARRFSNDLLFEAGLLAKTQAGQLRDFFSERITFPIRDASGAVVGFSARKYKESTFGGKYINTSETPLFKKSQLLFGLNFSRRRIAKERRAIVVEGQIDALRLIQEGFNLTVAGQGTAFGEGHVRELLNLGINLVYLAFDGDNAGREAAAKVGNLFQKHGVEAYVVSLPEKSDPDLILREQGPQSFLELIHQSVDYLSFLVAQFGKTRNLESPAAKTEMVREIANRIREWNDPLMVHESLRKLSRLAEVPEDKLGVYHENMPQLYIRKSASIGQVAIDFDRVLEMDLLRWLLLMGQEAEFYVAVCRNNLSPDHFYVTICRQIYETYLEAAENNRPRDLLSLAIDLDDTEAQLVISDLLQKKVNRQKAQEHFVQTVQKMLDRHWMVKREEVRLKIQSGRYSDEEVLELAKTFDQLKKQPPRVSNADS